MNATLLLLALSACISERATDAPAIDTDTDADTDTDTDTTPPETSSDAAYTYTDGILTIDRDFNPYPGLTIGFFCDGCGTEDGFTRAVAVVSQSDEGDLTVNLGRYGAGTDTRWSLAVVDDNLVPTQWLWESGEIAAELERNDTLGLTIPVQECVGEVMVDKLDFCTQISGDSIMPGSCWGTYVPPADCTDADSDGDVDPDTTDVDSDTDDDGDGLSNDEEEDAGTNPDDSDSDNDGHTDGDEVDDGTDPLDSEDPDDEDSDSSCVGDCAADDDGDGFSEDAGDCDDGWMGTNPGHDSEWLDGMDNDCDGGVDEGCDGDEATNGFCASSVDPDSDDDGDVDCAGDCAADDDGDGFSEDAGDCDDGYRYNYPGAPEYSDGVDQDCDGVVDNGCESDDALDELCD